MEPIPHHLLQVPQKAEPGHIRSGMDPVAAADSSEAVLFRVVIDCMAASICSGAASPTRLAVQIEPHAQSLGQDEQTPTCPASLV